MAKEPKWKNEDAIQWHQALQADAVSNAIAELKRRVPSILQNNFISIEYTALVAARAQGFLDAIDTLELMANERSVSEQPPGYIKTHED
jgi:hypothetical protein